MPFLLAQEQVEVTTTFWAGFLGVVIVLLLVDMVVFHRHAHEVRTKEAVAWTIVWIGLAAAFGGWVWWEFGGGLGAKFFTAYVVEESLSVDNLFVFLVIFRFFCVPPELQHRVLFFGILGAIVLRLVFIVVGLKLLNAAHWVEYVFGGILVLTALKLLLHKKDDGFDPEKSWMLRLTRRLVPTVPEYVGTRFTVVKDGKRYATMLFIVIVMIEGTDVVFAVDSVPAVLAIMKGEPENNARFVAYTSNVCAILGLRSLYFVLARFMGSFRYLEKGLSFVLAFIGVKMFGFFDVGSGLSLAIIGSILGIAVIASIANPEKVPPPDCPVPPPPSAP